MGSTTHNQSLPSTPMNGNQIKNHAADARLDALKHLILKSDGLVSSARDLLTSAASSSRRHKALYVATSVAAAGALAGWLLLRRRQPAG